MVQTATHIMVKRNAPKRKQRETPKTEKISNPNLPNDIVFDLTPDNVDSLGRLIVECVKKDIDLKCYSSQTMKNPDIPITEIPGLSFLFIQACLQQGLLGYLDWKLENRHTDQDKAILHNVTILIAGTARFNPEGKYDGHDVDETKLTFIRERSRAKFNQLIK